MKKYHIFRGLFLAGLFCSTILLGGFGGSTRAQEHHVSSLKHKDTTLLPNSTAEVAAGTLELLAQTGGQISSVVSDGEYLYVNSDPRLVVLSSEPNPQFVGRSELLPANVRGVALSGNTAVAVTGRDLYTIDVTDLSQPIILGTFPIDGYADTLLSAGSFVYVVGSSSITIVDIGDPAHPQVAGIVDAKWDITAAAVQGGLLLIGELFLWCGKYSCDEEEYDMLVVDVSQPGQPVLPAEVPFYWPITKIALDGSQALILTEGFEALEVFDISAPSHPVSLASAILPDDAMSIGGPVVNEGIAYILGYDPNHPGSAELMLYDVSAPSAPSLMTRLSIPVTGQELALAGNMIAVAGGCGLSMIDPLDVLQPLAGKSVTVRPGGWRGSMLVDGDVLIASAAMRVSG